MTAQAAREISYASSAATPSGRAVIRLLENATGRIGLIRRARGYESEMSGGASFYEVMYRRYGLRLEVTGALETIPAEGPVVVVSNHPYGVLDGLTMAHILCGRRGGDFRILANSVFRHVPHLGPNILPVDFEESREAASRNLASRAEALRYLAGGGAIGVFPGGTVSTAATPFGPPLDPAWRSFTARMIARSGATVVPLFFEGRTSRLFQVASHLHMTLRLGLLIHEFGRRTDGPVRVVVGEPIPRGRLDAFGPDSRGMMAFLRRETYALSPRPVPLDALGHEFEERHRRPEREIPAPAPAHS
nr:lysophospholipid acyltransferase family protein [Rubellimicrobium roseum]